NLDQAVLVDQALGPQGLGRDVGALELGQGVEVHHHVLHAERVLEALQLGDALLEGELTALESGLDVVPGLLALGAAAGGLAALAGGTPADAAARPARPRCRRQIMDFHSATSSI